MVSHAKKRELLPDEGCGVLFLPQTFARHRRGARVTDKNRGSCAHKLRVVTHAQLSHNRMPYRRVPGQVDSIAFSGQRVHFKIVQPTAKIQSPEPRVDRCQLPHQLMQPDRTAGHILVPILCVLGGLASLHFRGNLEALKFLVGSQRGPGVLDTIVDGPAPRP